MTDRELLELAAKAAGIKFRRSRLDDPACRDILIDDSPRNFGQISGPWNPLTDDGDALRLAVTLHMNVDVDPIAAAVLVDVHDPDAPTTCEAFGTDPYAATRRAITRAAAEIGKKMK